MVNYTCICKGFQLSPNSNALESYCLQPDHPNACVITQKYSSAIPLCFNSPKEKLGTCFKYLNFFFLSFHSPPPHLQMAQVRDCLYPITCSSVSLVTDDGLDELRFNFITIGGRNFFLLHIIQKGSGPFSCRSSGYWKLFAQVVAWKDTYTPHVFLA
jgi:hypothetical protein